MAVEQLNYTISSKKVTKVKPLTRFVRGHEHIRSAQYSHFIFHDTKSYFSLFKTFNSFYEDFELSNPQKKFHLFPPRNTMINYICYTKFENVLFQDFCRNSDNAKEKKKKFIIRHNLYTYCLIPNNNRQLKTTLKITEIK